mmetsp:Transcript_5384/g.17989  ORF Transcript_5384/g.17989 Transcript_5384/m.17989 type:complete len:269 (+) Transcript_5384:1940-2746(+)
MHRLLGKELLHGLELPADEEPHALLRLLVRGLDGGDVRSVLHGVAHHLGAAGHGLERGKGRPRSRAHGRRTLGHHAPSALGRALGHVSHARLGGDVARAGGQPTRSGAGELPSALGHVLEAHHGGARGGANQEARGACCVHSPPLPGPPLGGAGWGAPLSHAPGREGFRRPLRVQATHECPRTGGEFKSEDEAGAKPCAVASHRRARAAPRHGCLSFALFALARLCARPSPGIASLAVGQPGVVQGPDAHPHWHTGCQGAQEGRPLII